MKTHTTLKRDAWIHLWSTFKDGDQVMIVTENDDYWWGTFRPTHTCCRFADGKEFSWDEIVLICHDAFPVKFLKTGVCSEWFDTNRGKLSDTIRDTIREEEYRRDIVKDKLHEARLDKQQATHDKQEKEGKVRPWDAGYIPAPHRYGCGDPWFIEDVFTTGFNIGMDIDDEFLDLTDCNGLKGMLWDLDNVLEIT